jgi:hypothetical protein
MKAEAKMWIFHTHTQKRARTHAHTQKRENKNKIQAANMKFFSNKKKRREKYENQTGKDRCQNLRK